MKDVISGRREKTGDLPERTASATGQRVDVQGLVASTGGLDIFGLILLVGCLTCLPHARTSTRFQTAQYYKGTE